MNRPDTISVRQGVILFLSVYVLLALAVDTLFVLSAPVREILEMADLFVCLVFIVDFFYELLTAPSMPAFLKWGWIDLVSSIPALPMFRWGRIVRVIRIVRVLRGVHSLSAVGRELFRSRARGTLGAAAILLFTLVLFSAIAILRVETAPTSNIRTAGEALWWAFGTVTTVAYGEFYPVTAEGRILATMLMVAGVGLFGVITAYIASLFIQSQDRANEAELKQIASELKEIRDRLDRAGR